MKANPSSDPYIMEVFLFQLRTSLSAVLGASHIASRLSNTVPENLRMWLEKWYPVVEKWKVAENEAYELLEDGHNHDWEQVIYEMAKNMKDVSIAYSEGKHIEAPATAEGKMIINLAFEGGFEHINELIQPILNRDFSHL